MARYVGLLGLWLPKPVLPSLTAPFEHSHDLMLAPVVELLNVPPPEVAFTDDERLIEQTLPDGRIATGWLASDVMAGGERGGSYRAEGQYHPATVHWSLPDGSVAWWRVRHRRPVSATASRGALTVVVHDDRRHGRQPVVIRSSHPGTFEPSRWTFPGLVIGYDGPPADASGVIDARDGDTFTLSLT